MKVRAVFLFVAYRAEKKKPSAYMSHKDCSAHCPGLHINFHISEPSAANGHPSLLAQPTPLAGSVQSGFLQVK